MAHEFAHVAQLTGGTGDRLLGAHRLALGGAIRRAAADQEAGPGDEVEMEADLAADAILDGERPNLAGGLMGVLAQKSLSAEDMKEKLTPPRGHLIVGKTKTGDYLYFYNTKDVRAWGGDFTGHVMGYYFRTAFVEDPETLTGISQEFLKSRGVQVKMYAALADWTLPYAPFAIEVGLHAEVLAWMAVHYPKIELAVRREGEQPVADTPSAHTHQIDIKARPTAIVQFEPVATLVLPQAAKFVAGGAITAHVEFDSTDPDRMLLNYFPNRADFRWKMTDKDGTVVDDGPLLGPTGEIEYEFKPSAAGKYTIQVDVKSRYFVGGKSAHLSKVIEVVSEAQRDTELFEALLVDKNDPEKAFERDENHQLKLKSGQTARDIDQEIRLVSEEIGAIARLRDMGRLPITDADDRIAYLKDQLSSLESIRDKAPSGTIPYFVQGTFISRETSVGLPLTVILRRSLKALKSGRASYEVEAFDTTLTPGAPVRHAGIGDADANVDEAAAYQQAELAAVKDMLNDWHLYNDYPYGTVHLAIQLLEDNRVYEGRVDTYNWKRTGTKILTGVAVVGGVALIAASVFTGGASAPVGVLILEGVTLGASALLVAEEIDRRYKNGTLKPDARLVMNVLSLIPVGGFIGRLATGAERLSNGMMLVNLGTGVASMAMMTMETRQALLAIETQYTVPIANAEDAVAAAQAQNDMKAAQEAQKRLLDIQRRRDAAEAEVLGSSAVSGGLQLVALAAGARGLGKAAPTEPTVTPETTPPATTTPDIPPTTPTEPTPAPKTTPPATTTPDIPPTTPTEPTPAPKTTPPATTTPDIPPTTPTEPTPAPKTTPPATTTPDIPPTTPTEPTPAPKTTPPATTTPDIPPTTPTEPTPAPDTKAPETQIPEPTSPEGPADPATASSEKIKAVLKERIATAEADLADAKADQARLNRLRQAESQAQDEAQKAYDEARRAPTEEERTQLRDKETEALRRRKAARDELMRIAEQEGLDPAGADSRVGQIEKELAKMHEALNPKPAGTIDETMPLGGAYKDVEAQGGEVNHIPADSANDHLSTNKGPTVRMDVPDHYATKSWGSSKGAQKWRATQKQLIDSGKFNEAVKMDIDDLRGQFGAKYEKGIQQMLDYMEKSPDIARLNNNSSLKISDLRTP